MRSKNAITKLSSIPVTCATSIRNNASTLHPTRSEYDVHNNAIGAPECLANQSESRTTCTGRSSPMSNELYSNAAGNHCSYVRNDAMPLLDMNRSEIAMPTCESTLQFVSIHCITAR